MDLAEVREWMAATEGKGGIGRRDLMYWLIAEVERLTSERDELESDIVRYKMHLECADRAAKANGKLAEELQSSLTRSKAEGRLEGLREAETILS